jgi:transposase
MPQSRTLDGGVDVHNESMAVASIGQAHGAEVSALGTIGTRQGDSDHLIRKRPATAKPLVLVSEAGPGGDWRDRELTNQGQVCWGVAPSRIPKKAGHRVNTDRRDAVPRARLRRSGDLTPVSVPTVADEALRDLTRAREDAGRDLKSATFRLNAFLRRQDIRDTGRATWGPAHRRWLADVVCATPAQQIVFQAYIRAVTEPTARLQRLAQARQDQVHTGRLALVVEAQEGLRGGPCPVAVTLVAARGARTRVENPRHVLNSLGLIPSAYARGERRRQGSLPTAGHTRARGALVEGAWASRYPANIRRHLHLRLENLPKPIQDIHWKAHVRLCTQYRRLLARGTHATQVVVAMAWALAGFLGAMAPQVPVTLEVHQTDHPWTHHAARWPHLSAAAPPRCGATLDGVTRPAGLLVPRWRPAPDGCTSGGTQPTDIRRITRRM